MYKFLMKMFFCVCLLGWGVPGYASVDADPHLSEYSRYNIAHHDNIDDDVHAHKHKHSEDGEEHEHKHEHTKIAQNGIKVLNCSHKMISPLGEIETHNCFYEKTFISNPHPFGIFRPPIA